MSNTLEMILAVLVLSFWILFPIGLFLSLSLLDKTTEEVVRLEKLPAKDAPVRKNRSGDFRRPLILPH